MECIFLCPGYARKLYLDEGLGLDLKNTVYALDATTIDLCLSRFEWAPFRKAKAAVNLHTLLDIRDSIPAFIHMMGGLAPRWAKGDCIIIFSLL